MILTCVEVEEWIGSSVIYVIALIIGKTVILLMEFVMALKIEFDCVEVRTTFSSSSKVDLRSS